ncbi:endonuclease/exonuclease/phosphatase family protein [Virgibacillus dakarensis]|uniref:endonuclease/exonuclease/phosphatase family protein n=1 Tax=Virgibacillus dakarensis TaxID=1917889 RepID=UPI000B43B9D0|nr:endonuclease/exonuclease/phosphatase family protein [Virgibacillus dakarensis]
MKKWAFVLIFMLLLLPLNTVFAKNDTQEGRELTATVATYNLHAGIGTDGKYDLDRIAATIRDMDAEVIGLQEVDVHWGDRSNNENTIKLLAEKLDMEYFFAPIYDFDPASAGEPRRQYGVAILSKYPIVSAANRNITRLSTQDPDPEPKLAPGFLEAQININGANVWFYVTHLDYRGDPSVREMQVQDMLKVMSEHQYNILVGDMNAAAEADELQPLFLWFSDSWAMTESGNGYTYPAASPEKRIDMILASPRMKVNNVQVYSSLASDHLPVAADITLVRGSHSLTTDGMKILVEAFLENDEIASEEAAHALTMHLQALHYYESHGMKDKMIKHLGTFAGLLQQLKINEAISEHAYTTLQEDAEYLQEKWESK